MTTSQTNVLNAQMDTYFLFQNTYSMSQWVTILSMLDPLSHFRGNLLTLDTKFGPEQLHLIIWFICKKCGK